MKKLFLVLSFTCLCTVFAQEPRFMQKPDIADDGTIVFTYEEDLWILPPRTQTAVRLTSDPGRESGAKFSPDGQWIAYVGNAQGPTHVYVIPKGGGTPRQVTWTHAGVRIVDWSADGQSIYYISAKRRDQELWKVPASGGASERIPIGKTWEAALHPDGQTVVSTPSNADRMNWRGYRGGRQPDLYMSDIQGRDRRRITDWEGYDCQPVYAGSTLYFLSDREDNRQNIYAYNPADGHAKRLTRFVDWDVEDLSASTKALIFVNEGLLYIYDTYLNTVVKVDLAIPSDHPFVAPRTVLPSNFVNDCVPGPRAERVVVESRGDLFLFEKGQATPVNLTASAGSRECQPAISPDGTRLAFVSDKSGENEVYVCDLRPGAPWIPVTKKSTTWYYRLVWSPDGTRLCFGDKDLKLFWADLKAGTVTLVDRAMHQRDNEIYWEASDYDWSADGRMLAYAKCAFNMNSEIWLHDTKTGTSVRVADDRFDNLSPAFDRNGDYLYFLSNRNFTPALDPFMDNNIVTDASCVMAVALHAGRPAPFIKGAGLTPPSTPQSGIDLDGIAERVFMTPIKSGTYTRLTATRGRVFFLSKPMFGFPGDEVYAPRLVTPWSLETVDMATLRRHTILTDVSIATTVSPDGSSVGFVAGDHHGVVGTSQPATTEEGALVWGDATMRIDPTQEFRQIFDEVWRQERNFFYDVNMHGLDWKAIGDRHRALLPSVPSRQDLNVLLGKLIAELGTSHMYIMRPGDLPRPVGGRVPIGCLGMDLVPENGRYRIAHIVRTPNDDPFTRNPVCAPDVRIHEGDYVLAIDDSVLTLDRDYGYWLQNKAGVKITLTLNHTPSMEGAWTTSFVTLRSEQGLRYTEWVERNYATVKSATSGRVGYFHLSDMDKDGLEQFERGFRAERFRDGLIIDVRGNGGGFVSWFVLDKLERELRYFTRTRDFEPMLYPHGIVRGPMVMLCDESSGSDGDLIAQHFKDRKLGTLIGTRTWGGLIGIINFMDLIDGGMVTQVNVGFGNLNGEWVVENTGVTPDIEVPLDPAALEQGKDTQLLKGIEMILKDMERTPAKKVTIPRYPGQR